MAIVAWDDSMSIGLYLVEHTTGIDQSLAKHLLNRGLSDRMQAG